MQVPLLANYSQQANDLGLLVRYYYTVRELSSRAWEIFAFKAQQGEVLVEQDPYVIVQPGYAHAWNTHGGSAWLHELREGEESGGGGEGATEVSEALVEIESRGLPHTCAQVRAHKRCAHAHGGRACAQR